MRIVPLVVSVAVIVVAVSPAAGATIFVDAANCPGPGDGSMGNPYCTIQTAIDNAVDTDEIIVAQGTYFEKVNFAGKAIVVRSSGGPAVTTINAATPRVSVVKFVNGEGPTTVLDGFTITGANNNGGPGGLELVGSSPTITNCILAGNTGIGGGMENDNSNPTVINCIFIDNTATDGGGMRNRNSSPLVINCLFIDNFAGWGGGMDNGTSNPIIINCTFFGNDAILAGGAIRSFSSQPELFNCVVWGNVGGGRQIAEDVAGSTTVRYSDVQGGFPGSTNIDADPLFVDPNNDDFRLSPGSPCIDAGDNTAVAKGTTTDLDGNARFVDDPDTIDSGNGDPPVVDMGAYELQVVSACPWDCGGDDDGNVGITDFLALLAQWGTPGSCDFDGGGVGINDFLQLLANWGPCP